MAQVESDSTYSRLEHPLYQEDLLKVCNSGVDWNKLSGSTIGVTGATGMVGTFLIDVLMMMANQYALDISLIALGRDEQRAKHRLPYFDSDRFSFEQIDVSIPGNMPSSQVDVVFHLASTTHPRAYATQPIGTITSNIVGLTNMLDWLNKSSGSNGQLLFASSVEIYGENRGDVERFDEDYCGYIDCNSLRAGYPEAKRLGEALCQAYAAEHGMQSFIPRLPRLYGPTLASTDTKALSQFLFRAIEGQNVILKSQGLQRYSYLYVADAVSGLLWVLTRCTSGIAYNVADEASDIQLRDLAKMVASAAGVDVIFDLPDAVEQAGYSTATKALMDGSRLKDTGWWPLYDISMGLMRTMKIIGRG